MSSHANEPMTNMQDDHIDFRSLVYGIWENKKLVLATTFVTAAIAIIFTWHKTPQFEANTLIQVESQGRSSLNGLAQQLTGATAGGTNPAGKQEALIRSRVILEPVVKQLGLDIVAVPHHIPLIGKFFSSDANRSVTIKQLIVPPSEHGKKLALRVVDATHYRLIDEGDNVLLKGEIGKLVSNKQGFAVEVDAIHAKPNTIFDVVKLSSSEIANGIASRIKITEMPDASNNATDIIQVSMHDSDPVRLTKILNAITAVAQSKDIEQKRMEITTTLDFLSRQLPVVRADLEKAETAYNHYRAESGKVDIRLETQQLMVQLNGIVKQITNSEVAKINLLQRYTEEHPFVIELGEKVKELNRQKFSLEEKIKSLPASDQIAVKLMRDAKVKNGLYLVLLSKIQEAQVTKAGTVSDVRILAPAVMPEAPVSKNAFVVFVASLVLGLLLGGIIAVGRKAFFRRVSDPRWVEQNLNITNFAIIPYSKQQAKNAALFKAKQTKTIDILAEKFPHDLSLEALRSLRTSFQIMQVGASNNIVTLTGVSPGIGKSFVSVNFAALLAEAGKKVLLIDGDIRKGLLHNYFDAQRAPGLVEILNGTAQFEKVVRKTPFASLSFLACGIYPHNPSELLLGQRFKDLLDVASQSFDLVIIDTAPVLAATDSTIIGALASTNLVIIGSDAHQPEEIRLTLKRLSTAGVSVQGTIFNYLKQETAVHTNYQYQYKAEPEITL